MAEGLEALRSKCRLAIVGAFALAILFQYSSFAIEDVRRYRGFLNREQTSTGLAFTRRLEDEVLSQWTPGTSIRIVRDARIYLPPRPEYEIHLRWRSPEHQNLVDIRPDLILLLRSEIDQFRDESMASESFDPDQAPRSYRFYLDLLNNAVPGSRTIMETDFGIAFVRDEVPEP